MRPLIGITLDWQEQGSYSTRAHYALRQHYFDAVWAAGGLPVAIPLNPNAIGEYLARVGGLVIPGGDYPTPSSWYADPHNLVVSHPRVEVDMLFLNAALDADMPLLAICAGFQELTVAMGGKLHWRIAQKVKNPERHREIPLEKAAHALEIAEGSLLHRLVGKTRMDINSHHYEGLADPGRALVSGQAPDGVVEAIEVPGKRFALGVQWHPEMFTAEGCDDRKLFEGLVAAAKE